MPGLPLSFIPAALRRALRAKVLLLQMLGNAAIFACAVFWLYIPDSHVWQFLFSVLLALAIIVALLWHHTVILSSLRTPEAPAPLTLRRHWRARGTLALWMLIFYALYRLVLLLGSHSTERAGYLNSRLGPHLRTVFTYQRLDDWQQDIVSLMVWVVLEALLLPFVIETVVNGFSGPSWRSALRVLCTWQHWLTVALIAGVGWWLTEHLLDWHPGHSVSAELISVTVRTLLVYVADVLLVTFALAVVAELLARKRSSGNTTL